MNTMKKILYGLTLLPILSSGQEAATKLKVEKLVKEMTIEEKATLLSGDGWWRTHAIKRLNIPSIYLTDGPHGLRKSVGAGLGEPVKATGFPTASALASSWNVEILQKVGIALAEESQANDVQILLGPGINMKRSPLGGRNFEYFSEDPILSGKLAAAYINGVQSQGVGTSLKHFAANNQEFERMSSNSIVDERTLHEIYLTAFEIAVTEAKPWTVMSSYNKLNGTYTSEDKLLLTDILRNKWGFEGFVMSDWGAVNDRVTGVRAGLNLEMPGSGTVNKENILKAVQDSRITMVELDKSVSELLNVILKADKLRGRIKSFDKDSHHRIAREAAAESIVLLKNDNQILPLHRNQKIAFIGSFAKMPRYQGAGSSQVNPFQISNAFDEYQKLVGSDLQYAQGYNEEGETSAELLKQAVETAKKSDVVVIFAGLPDSYESEGFDRTTLDLPEGHNKLISQVAMANKNVIVVLMNGSAVTMPWLGEVKGVIESWLAGQAGGGAVADILSGTVNPSGKLSETFPKKIEDTPTAFEFPGLNKQPTYGEGLFIGYRYYDKKRIDALFPFGHGLSYTSFSYNDIQLNKADITDEENVTVSVKVKNTGSVSGKEVIQLYIKSNDSLIARPTKELKAFKKLELRPGEEKTVSFTLNNRAFTYYNTTIHDWTINSGRFDILVGNSSASLPLTVAVRVTNTRGVVQKLNRNSMVKEFKNHPNGKAYYRDLVKAFGIDLDSAPPKNLSPEQLLAKKKSDRMMLAFVNDAPVYKLLYVSDGKFTEKMLDEIINNANK